MCNASENMNHVAAFVSKIQIFLCILCISKYTYIELAFIFIVYYGLIVSMVVHLLQLPCIGTNFLHFLNIIVLVLKRINFNFFILIQFQL